MHDGINFETMGIPAAVVVLNVFKELAYMKRRQLNCEQFDPVIIQGHLGLPDICRQMGEAAIPGVIEWLTAGKLTASPTNPNPATR